jgi:hypothetical protein
LPFRVLVVDLGSYGYTFVQDRYMPTKSPTATSKCSQNVHAVKQAKLVNLFKKKDHTTQQVVIYLGIKI